MGMDDRLTAVIEGIYAGAGRADGWAAILDAVADITDAASGCIVAADSRDPRSNVDCFRNIDPAWIEAYNAHYHTYDPSPRLFQTRPGRVHIDHVTGPRLADATGDGRVFYHEVMAPQNFRHTLALGLASDPEWNAGLILQRTPGQGEFSPEALAALDQLAGHLKRGLGLHARLSQAGGLQAGMAASLDRAPVGALLLDAGLRTVFANRRAEDLLQRTAALSVATGGLSALHPTDDRELQRLLRNAVEAARGRSSQGGGNLWIRGPDWQSTLHAEISPVALGEEGDPVASLNAFATVWLTARDSIPNPSPALLSEVYDLTPAEGVLLTYLVQGSTPAEIAEAREVSPETVRGQLKSLMTKLGVSRQADLVRLVLAGPGMMAGDREAD
jgi:DNA-binding CsgD family transcriptional regulator/PAS domain-containing protein